MDEYTYTQLVDMAGFRKKNGLKQSDVANIIGTSGSFISLVEKGSAKLPDDKLELLVDNSDGWNGLVPCYDRLVNLQGTLIERGCLTEEKADLYPEPFVDELSYAVVNKIKFGKIGITSEIADKLVGIYPMVNYDWLIYGEGKMLYDDAELRQKGLIESVNRLEKEVAEMQQKLDSILDLLTAKQ